MITIDVNEATEILQAIDSVDFKTFPVETQLSAISGVINIVKGMQAIGYRITKPLKVIKQDNG